MHQGLAAAAGAAFREAASAARARAPERAVDLSRESAEHYLRAGRIDAGLDALRDVLGPLGLSMPGSTAAALAELVARHVTRPWRTRAKAAPHERAALVARLDACAAVSIGLAAVDQRAAVFQARALDLAMRVDDLPRLQRALSFEACYMANGGHRTEARTAPLVAAARAAAGRVATPEAEGYARGAEALFAFHRGRWRRCAEHARISASIFRAAGHRYWKEEVTQGTYAALATLLAGDLLDGAAMALELLGRADARGDLYGGTNLRTGLFAAIPLLDDDVARARDDLRLATSWWRGDGFIVQHFFLSLARANLALYEGDADAALAEVDAVRARLRANLLSRAEWVRVALAAVEARAAFASSRRGGGWPSPGLRARVEAVRRTLRATPAGWALAHHAMFAALAARSAGDVGLAARLLVSAEAAYTAADMAVDALCARRARAVLEGGARGLASRDDVDGALAQRGVRAPERFARLYVPT
jgi:hypothetical protein